MGVSERREREKQARMSGFLDAARDLLLEKGFTGTTTKKIAERCEMSEATLFFYFKNKDEVFASLLFESIGFWADGLDKISKAKLTPEKKLARVWQFYKSVREEHPEYLILSAYLSRPNSIAGVSDEIRSDIVRLSGGNFQQLAEILEDITGRSDGRIMADMMWSTYLGLMIVRDTRENLKTSVHPNDRELAAAYKILEKGLLG